MRKREKKLEIMTIKTKKMRSRKNKTIEKKKLLDTERKWNIYSSVPINTYFKNKARTLLVTQCCE